MPSVSQNLEKWNEDYDWTLGDDNWSHTWGGASAQWFGTIFPRIRRFLPAPAVLEIAPGFGRWSAFLLESCDTFVGVDVSPICVEACRARFAGRRGATFEANDGRSLPMVGDSSIDFAFSFDSLVHVEADSLASYVAELARVLTPEGVAFLHHSNFGAYRRVLQLLAPMQGSIDRLPPLHRKALSRCGVYRGEHWRAQSVTAGTMVDLCAEVGLRCVGQEVVNWVGGVLLVDCMSVVTRPGSRWDHEHRIVKNRLWRMEARAVRRSASIGGADHLGTSPRGPLGRAPGPLAPTGHGAGPARAGAPPRSPTAGQPGRPVTLLGNRGVGAVARGRRGRSIRP